MILASSYCCCNEWNLVHGERDPKSEVLDVSWVYDRYRYSFDRSMIEQREEFVGECDDLVHNRVCTVAVLVVVVVDFL